MDVDRREGENDADYPDGGAGGDWDVEGGYEGGQRGWGEGGNEVRCLERVRGGLDLSSVQYQ